MECNVLEMVSENTLINVPVHPSINIDVITSDDPNPKFVNVEVIRGNTISGNNRRYSNSNTREIIGMIPGLQGFLGHPDPSKYSFEFREPQCIYVGALLETLQDGTLRSIAKAYIFKSSNLREWIPKSIASGNPMTVSINGRADVVHNGEYIDVISINKLESIDWANPGTEGLDTSKAISIVTEINNNNGGSNYMEVKDIIKNTTVTEFKAYNPDAYIGVIKSVTLAELKENNPLLIKDIENAVVISEMKLNINGKEESIKLTEMQNIITKFEDKISELVESNNNIKLTEYKAKKIAEMIPEHLCERVSKRIVGCTTESEIDSRIEDEIAFIREMTGNDINSPIGRIIDHDDDDIKKSVSKLFGVSIKD